MKIVLATHHFPPRRIGGVELLTHRIARWLARRGHHVEVVCVETVSQGNTGQAWEEKVDGVLVHRLELGLNNSPYPLGLNHRNEWLATWFQGLLRQVGPDVVDIRSCYLLSASIVGAARRVGRPVLLSLHDYWFLCPRMTLLRSDGTRCPGAREAADCAWCLLAEKRRYRLSDHLLRGRLSRLVRGTMTDRSILAQMLGWDGLLALLQDRRTFLRQSLECAGLVVARSPFLKDRLVVEGLPPARIHVVPCGLDLEHWQFPERSRNDGNTLRIGYLGHLAPHKGAHLLIQAFKNLQISDTIPTLKLYGDTNYLPAYGRKLRGLAGGNSRIVFAGRYNNAQVEEILAGIDVLVVPSRWYETGPLVTLEAFASRTPVVATDLPNMNNQVVHEVNGLLFKPDDVTDLARQLQRLLDEPALLHRLAANIPPVKTFEEEMREIMQLYETISNR